MLRTCGVTGQEFNGGQGHDLASLITLAALTPPVDRSDLVRLSQAYLRTRYAPFPPRGLSNVPSSSYGSDDAEWAFQIATAMVDWGRSTSQVEMSLGGEGVEMNGGSDQRMVDIGE